MSSPRWKLYEFRLSHFCEKARWAFDHKRVPYESKVVLPGPHRISMQRLSGQSQVPVAVCGDLVIAGSGDICDHLDAHYPEHLLTPREPALREQALSWERRLDEELGKASRRVFYFHTLNRPRFLVPFYVQGGPWWGRAFYAAAFPLIAKAIRSMYRVDADRAAADTENLRRLFTELDQHFRNQEYLVGGTFTRADMTLAALMGPMLRAEGYGASWPSEDDWPTELLAWARPFEQSRTASRVRQLYADREARRSTINTARE